MINLLKHIILSVLCLVTLPSWAQEVSAVLKDKQIKIGEQTSIEISLRSTADGQLVKFPDLLDTISGKIEIIEVSEIDTAYDEQDISIRTLSQTITITSWDSGFHAVPPFVFFLGDQKLETKADLLEVKSVPLDAEADIKDIKNIMEVPFSLWDWILVHRYWFLGGLALILLGFVAFILIKRLKKEKPEAEVFVPKEEADVVAIRQLNNLEKAELWQKGEVNRYYTELSHILREYLENRFQLSALEKTTDEIESLLKYHKEVEARHSEQFIELMQLCDMAKFAKQEPLASENKEAIQFAYKFINETKIVEQIDKSEIGDQRSEMGSTEDDGRTRTLREPQGDATNSNTMDDSQIENSPKQNSASKEEKSS
jgi:hypothetical protein